MFSVRHVPSTLKSQVDNNSNKNTRKSRV